MSNTFEIAPPVKTLEDVAAVTQEALAVVQENLEGLVKASQEQVQKHYDDSVAAAKEHLGKVHAQVSVGYEEFSAYSKGNVDALVASGSILAKGFEDILKILAAQSRASFEKYIALSTASLSVTSVTELTTLSGDYARTSYEALLADASTLQELVATVANEALAPITARVNLTVEKFAKPLAA